MADQSRTGSDCQIECTCPPTGGHNRACYYHGDNGTMVVKVVHLMCPSCGSMMYRARQLKGYPKTGPESERLTCAVHGPHGRFRHLGSDRRA